MPLNDEQTQEEETALATVQNMNEDEIRALVSDMIKGEVKSKSNQDNPQLERMYVMKYLFSHLNQKMEEGDYLNMRGEIVGRNQNKLVLLLRVLNDYFKVDLAGRFANQMMGTSVSWLRKGRQEGTEWGRTAYTQNSFGGRDPLVPSGERTLGADGATTTNNRKRGFFR